MLGWLPWLWAGGLGRPASQQAAAWCPWQPLTRACPCCTELPLPGRQRAFCDRHGRYLDIPPWRAPELEHRLSLLMQEHTKRSRSGRLLLVFEGGSSSDPSLLQSPLVSWPAGLPVVGEGPGDGEEGPEDEGPPAAGRSSPPRSWLAPPWAPLSPQLAEALGQPGQGDLEAAQSPWRSYAQQLLQRRSGQRAAGEEPPPGAAPGSAAGEAAARPGEGGPFLNLAPFMNRAPLSVRRFTPATRVHELFLFLSLRHLCVIDRTNAAVGMITRKDLVRMSRYAH